MTKDLLYSIIYKMTLRKCIVFESAPDFSDNTKAVYDELQRRNYGNIYKFVWITYDEHPRAFFSKSEVVCVRPFSVRCRLYLGAAKCVISCNRYIGKHCKGQYAIYLSHGTPLKNVKGHLRLPDSVDACVIASNEFINTVAEAMQITDINKIVPLGFPRNDAFSAVPKSIATFFGDSFKKIIVWYPTLRQHKEYKNRVDSSDSLPIIHNKNAAIEINDFCKKRNILVVIKPHYAQDIKYIQDEHLSNIVFIDESFFPTHNLIAYEFLNSCDALLTDYSSVYYDYLLADKPIGLVWEDIDEYKKKRGLIDDYEQLTAGGVKIYNKEELMQFIDDVANGIDRLKKNREECCRIANISVLGDNTARVVDFIIEKAKL